MHLIHFVTVKGETVLDPIMYRNSGEACVCVCMYACANVCVHANVHMCMGACVCMCACMCMHVRMCASMHCTCVCCVNEIGVIQLFCSILLRGYCVNSKRLI